jgi:hypothetical protein
MALLPHASPASSQPWDGVAVAVSSKWDAMDTSCASDPKWS